MSAVMNTYNRYNITLVKGDYFYLFDENGKKYVDFATGIAVTNLGHSNKEIAEIICRQSATLMHTSNLYKNPIQEEVAQIISDLSFGCKVFSVILVPKLMRRL